MNVKHYLFFLLMMSVSACASRGSGYQQTAQAYPQPVTKTVSRNQPQDEGEGLVGEERQGILNYHNKVRADVNVKPLKWSGKVAGYAQIWANRLAATGCRMQHSSGSGYGENLFMGTLGYYGVVDAAKSWESEKRYYAGGPLNSSNWQKTGHYTQMVWHSTTHLGCAKVACNNNLIVVCNYNPAGNYMGQSPY